MVHLQVTYRWMEHLHPSSKLNTHACMSQPHGQQRGKLMRSHLTVSLPWNPPSLKVFVCPFCGITSEGFVPSSQSGPSLPQIAAIIHRSKEASRISGCGFNSHCDFEVSLTFHIHAANLRCVVRRTFTHLSR